MLRSTALLAAVLAVACSAPVDHDAPAASAAGGPRSVVLVSIDTLRADHLGCYGYPRDTSPVIDALAQESLFFELCLAPIAATLPSHTSLFTGAYPLEHGVLGNLKGGGRRFVANPVLRLFADIARERGYRTAGFVSSVAVSANTGISGGFEHYDEPDEPQRTAGATNERLFPWLDALDRVQPLFLFVHYFDPHWPYRPPPPFDQTFAADGAFLDSYIAERGITEAAVRPNQNELSTRETIDGYDGEVRYVDGELGRLFGKLRELGLWEDAAVVLIGDHGEGLGEHGQIGHGWIWREQLHVPLMMRIPGERPRRIAAPLSLVDVLPTVLGRIGTDGWSDFLRQATGVDVLAPQRVVEPIFSQRSARERADLTGDVYALSTERWKFILDPERGDLLFDWSGDVLELDNALEREAEVARSMKDALVARIAHYQARGQALGEVPADGPMDPALVEKLRALGYLD